MPLNLIVYAVIFGIFYALIFLLIYKTKFFKFKIDFASLFFFTSIIYLVFTFLLKKYINL
ncbi:MAG: hypothetical protein Ta2C_09360 [Candidatus Endomicrobiellum trichonymphae]|nr:MAG: hypothetical protein Ta2C_09360 [Candidatus Endomicrobium trichonymphae]